MATRADKAGDDHLEALLALHKYFLNADFLRDAFMKRVDEQRTHGTTPVDFLDNYSAMSLWYATLYVVIEGWRELGLSDPRVDGLLACPLVDDLRVFRNQLFHYQRAYDNPRLLHFLGRDDDAATAATGWIARTHGILGVAIRDAIEDATGEEGRGVQ